MSAALPGASLICTRAAAMSSSPPWVPAPWPKPSAPFSARRWADSVSVPASPGRRGTALSWALAAAAKKRSAELTISSEDSRASADGVTTKALPRRSRWPVSAVPSRAPTTLAPLAWASTLPRLTLRLPASGLTRKAPVSSA